MTDSRVFGVQPPGDVTELLSGWSKGDAAAVSRLLPLVYDQLRSIARQALRRERPGHTLGPTAVVHEAFIALVNQRRSTFTDRQHFYAVAAQAMRRILVDHARAKKALKRGGAEGPEPVCEVPAGPELSTLDVVALDTALQGLAQLDPPKARLVELRYFVGLSIEETAQVLESSPATVKRDWVVAKTWLFRELGQAP